MCNILLRYCRETTNHSNADVAAALVVSVDTYLSIEKGETLLSWEQAEKLGQFYEANPRYFVESALQTDLLHSREMVIKMLQSSNERLAERLSWDERKSVSEGPVEIDY